MTKATARSQTDQPRVPPTGVALASTGRAFSVVTCAMISAPPVSARRPLSRIRFSHHKRKHEGDPKGQDQRHGGIMDERHRPLLDAVFNSTVDTDARPRN